VAVAGHPYGHDEERRVGEECSARRSKNH